MGKSELKGNKQVKTKNFELDEKCQKYGCDDKKVVQKGRCRPSYIMIDCNWIYN